MLCKVICQQYFITEILWYRYIRIIYICNQYLISLDIMKYISHYVNLNKENS